MYEVNASSLGLSNKLEKCIIQDEIDNFENRQSASSNQESKVSTNVACNSIRQKQWILITSKQ